jgi:hypothetical protein
MSHVVTQFETAVQIEVTSNEDAYATVIQWIANKGAEGYELKSFISDSMGFLIAVAQRPVRTADAGGRWSFPG